jgi:urease subunit gamma
METVASPTAVKTRRGTALQSPPLEAAVPQMQLTPRETEKLLVYVAADLARRRRERGLKLNLPEATALITEAMLEGARDGRRVSEVRALGRQVLTRDDVMDEVPDLLTVVHVEATFPDGTKLVSCHDPIP